MRVDVRFDGQRQGILESPKTPRACAVPLGAQESSRAQARRSGNGEAQRRFYGAGAAIWVIARIAHLSAESESPRRSPVTTIAGLRHQSPLWAGPGARTIMSLVAGAESLAPWLPLYLMTHISEKRRGEIASQLSNVLDLLVVCVEAGLGSQRGDSGKWSAPRRTVKGQLIGHELRDGIGRRLIPAPGLGTGAAAAGGAHQYRRSSVLLAATMIQSEQLGSRMAPGAGESLSDSSAQSAPNSLGRRKKRRQKTTVKILISAGLFYFARDDDRDRRPCR